ncbi:hypothetical protein B0919_12040 [Hymenobacter sp. CRA2]|nr:hypothetical protein B0919_12040 [Hymenobacter sp. CRA2]
MLAGLLALLSATAQAQATPAALPDTLRKAEVLQHLDATAQQTPGTLTLRPVAGGRARILVPAAFRPLDKEAISLKYPIQGGPQEAYSDNALAVNLAFRQGPNPMKQAQLTANIAERMVQAFSSRQPGFKDLGHGIKTINGRQVVYLEFMSDVPLSDKPNDRVYNLMFVTDAGGQALVCTFNCVQRLQKQWQPVAQQILNSLQVP